jgi:uncharacterized protein YndB with AHSA1/START domain
MTEKTFIMERVFDAPKKTVWLAITEKELMKQWYFDLPEFKPEVGFKFEITGGEEGGKQYLHHFEITEVISEQKLVHTWTFVGYEGMSYLTYELFDQGEKTLLKLTHSGIETFPADIPDFAFEKFEEGWNHIINVSLKDFLEKNKTTPQMNNLLFDFTVDKTAKTVFITREFNAELSLVWDAFTKQEILDQWWAPKPWVSKTKIMNFEVGGRRFYAMVSPEGQEHWSIQKYTSITPKTNFKYLNAFADKDENPELPGSDWNYNFSEQNGTTKVSITIFNNSLERMEKMIEMGFQGGFTMTLNYLETLLATLLKK